MNDQMKLMIMQNMYAASVAETVNTYQRLNVLDKVVEAKLNRQNESAAMLNKQFGVKTPEDVFSNLADVFGCANWEVVKNAQGLIATATSCKLCALSKKMGGANPCIGWCIGPMKGMLKALDDYNIKDEDIEVESTLLNGVLCKVIVKY